MIPATSNVRPFWEEVEAIFDPEVAVVDPALFVEREPAYNPLSHIERALRRPTRVNRKYLLRGTVGNGKTSELHHFADRLGSDRMIVLIDLWRHFQDGVGNPAAMSNDDPTLSYNAMPSPAPPATRRPRQVTTCFSLSLEQANPRSDSTCESESNSNGPTPRPVQSTHGTVPVVCVHHGVSRSVRPR
jgi:hypothetical protein